MPSDKKAEQTGTEETSACDRVRFDVGDSIDSPNLCGEQADCIGSPVCIGLSPISRGRFRVNMISSTASKANGSAAWTAVF